MNRTISIVMLALIAIVANAQQRFTVRDSLTQKPVAFTSVWFGNETGGYTDGLGTIEIPEGTERIRLSHICYEAKNISVTDISEHTVLLVPKSIPLAEVCVSAKSPKRTKITTVGLVKEKTQTCHRGANGFEMALFIPYDSTWPSAPYIHSILASLDYSTHWLTFTTIKKPIYATLRFDLRKPDALTGAPRDESAINGGIIIQSDQRVGNDEDSSLFRRSIACVWYCLCCHSDSQIRSAAYTQDRGGHQHSKARNHHSFRYAPH